MSGLTMSMYVITATAFPTVIFGNAKVKIVITVINNNAPIISVRVPKALKIKEMNTSYFVLKSR